MRAALALASTWLYASFHHSGTDSMTRIIERRQAAASGETVLELRFFRTKEAEVRAYISCDDVIIDTNMMILLSRPAAEAFLDALALCEKEGVANLWVDDPLGLFPPDARPTRVRR